MSQETTIKRSDLISHIQNEESSKVTGLLKNLATNNLQELPGQTAPAWNNVDISQINRWFKEDIIMTPDQKTLYDDLKPVQGAPNVQDVAEQAAAAAKQEELNVAQKVSTLPKTGPLGKIILNGDTIKTKITTGGEQPRDVEALIKQLCTIYKINFDDIKNNVLIPQIDGMPVVSIENILQYEGYPTHIIPTKKLSADSQSVIERKDEYDTAIHTLLETHFSEILKADTGVNSVLINLQLHGDLQQPVLKDFIHQMVIMQILAVLDIFHHVKGVVEKKRTLKEIKKVAEVTGIKNKDAITKVKADLKTEYDALLKALTPTFKGVSTLLASKMFEETKQAASTKKDEAISAISSIAGQRKYLNMGNNVSRSSFDTLQSKYLKYKQKYLNLKNNF
jgi:hypothetical protein